MVHHLLGLNKYLMILNGQWKFKKIHPILSLLYIINIAWIYLYTIEVHATCIVSAIILRDCPIASAFVMNYVECITSIVITFILKYNGMLKILDSIADYENGELEKEIPTIKKVYKGHGKLVDTITKVAFTTIASAGVLWFIFGMQEEFPPTETCPGSVKGLVFQFWYPFDIKRFIWIGHIVDITINISSCTFMSYTKLLPICLLVYVLARIKILQEHIRNLKNIKEDERYYMIKRIVQRQQEIIKIMAKVQTVTGLVVMIFYFGEAANLASYLIMIMLNLSVGLVLKMMVPFLFIAGELYIFSWLAEEIIQESLAISDVIYNETDWLHYDKQDKKMLLLIMTRSQMQLSIKVPFIQEMSIETFKKIMKLCYSIQTFMAAMRN